MKASQWTKFAAGAAGLAVVFGILILINILAAPLRIRADLTEENLYTLSSNTQSLVGDLDREVTLKFYFSRSADDLPIPLKQYAGRVQDLLEEYDTLGGDDVRLEVYNPRPDTDDEEWAQRYGLVGQPLNPMGGEPVYFGLVAVSGAREAAIPFLAPQMEPQLEYNVTRLLDEVSTVDKPVIGIMSPLPVQGAQANPYGPQAQQQRPWGLLQELERQFETQTIDPGADSIPDGITLLLVIHPKDFSPETMYAMDQFVLRGGRMVALMDPLCIVDEPPQANPMMMQSPGGSSDLNALTASWGYTLSPSMVLADPRAATRLNLGQGRVSEFAAFLTYSEEGLSEDQMATSGLESMSLPFPGALRGQPVEGLSAEPLLTSSDESGLVNTFMATQPGLRLMDNAQPVDSLPLAIRLQGTFPSAFPEGPPDVAGGDPDAAARLNGGRPHLSEAEGETAVTLIADVDFANDQYATRTVNIFGQQLIEPINDNLIFVLNLVEQMTGSQEMIGLRSRGTFSRPFDRVEDLSRQAQERWQAEEAKLTETIQEAQARLNELQQAKTADQQLILSPEQEAEIENVREQRFEAQKRLREVRKNLRQDIERLGFQLKAINLAAVPLVVAGFGILRWVNRRKKARGRVHE